MTTGHGPAAPKPETVLASKIIGARGRSRQLAMRWGLPFDSLLYFVAVGVTSGVSAHAPSLLAGAPPFPRLSSATGLDELSELPVSRSGSVQASFGLYSHS